MNKQGRIKVVEGDLLPDVILSSTAGYKINLLEESKKSKLVLFFFPSYGVGKQYSD